MKKFSTALLLVLISACSYNCNNDDASGSTEATTPPVATIPAPAQISYTLLNVYPHDTSSYTQGLQYLNGFLYEGTGNPRRENNRSKLRKVDIKTGKVLKETFIKGELFGEGITVMGDKIYQTGEL